MKINQEQKDLLIGILEKTHAELDMDESMQFGEDLLILSENAKAIKVQTDGELETKERIVESIAKFIDENRNDKDLAESIYDAFVRVIR
jgi:hypothetical protein